MNNNLYIIKIGTASLFTTDGLIDLELINNLADQIAELNKCGIKIVLVSSGAVGLGKFKTGLTSFNKISNTIGKQIFAGIGQPILMNLYEKVFEKHKITVSQALLTRSDFADREKYLNMRTVLQGMIDNDIIPIINENDVLSPEELDFSDNDQLAAYVSGMLGATKLIILTVVDGLYNKNPQEPDACKFELVEKIDDDILSCAEKIKSSLGTGGMISKLNTANLTMNLGIDMIITLAKNPNVLIDIYNGKKVGTLFHPIYKPNLNGIKRWLSTGAFPRGEIVVSNTITDLIKQGKRASILLAGVEDVIGEFKKGDVVSIRDVNGKQLGFGIIKESSSILISYLYKKEKDFIVIHTDYFMSM